MRRVNQYQKFIISNNKINFFENDIIELQFKFFECHLQIHNNNKVVWHNSREVVEAVQVPELEVATLHQNHSNSNRQLNKGRNYEDKVVHLNNYNLN